MYHHHHHHHHHCCRHHYHLHTLGLRSRPLTVWWSVCFVILVNVWKCRFIML
jgi:hypothetical protein